MRFPLPKYIAQMPDGNEKDLAIDRFYLQLACVYASRSGRIPVLAKLLGMNYGTLKSQIRCRPPYVVMSSTFEKVEKLLGPNFIR